MDAAGNVVAEYVYGTRANVPDYITRNGGSYRLVSDHLGSVRLVVDSSTGSVVQRLSYDEFGILPSTSSDIAFQPFVFAGGIGDQHGVPVRFGARDYDSTLGRWTHRDPIRFLGGQGNLYIYVNSNPINVIDATGLASKCESRYLIEKAFSDAYSGIEGALRALRNHWAGGDLDVLASRWGETFWIGDSQVSHGEFGNFLAGVAGAAVGRGGYDVVKFWGKVFDFTDTYGGNHPDGNVWDYDADSIPWIDASWDEGDRMKKNPDLQRCECPGE